VAELLPTYSKFLEKGHNLIIWASQVVGLRVLAVKREWAIRSFPSLQDQVFLKHAGIKINSSCHLETAVAGQESS
jgi:hypothetical protein